MPTKKIFYDLWVLMLVMNVCWLPKVIWKDIINEFSCVYQFWTKNNFCIYQPYWSFVTNHSMSPNPTFHWDLFLNFNLKLYRYFCLFTNHWFSHFEAMKKYLLDRISSTKSRRLLFNFETIKCSAYWMAAPYKERWLFQWKKGYSCKIWNFYRYLFPIINNNYHYDI